MDCQIINAQNEQDTKIDIIKKKEESEGWEEQAHLRKNQVEMKTRDNLIKNSVAGLNTSLDTAQEGVGELEGWFDNSPTTLLGEVQSWKTLDSKSGT